MIDETAQNANEDIKLNVRFWPILLKNSFLGHVEKISAS